MSENKRFELTIALLAIAVLLLSLLFIPIDHRINAPSRLEGLVQRALVAPENGYLHQALVKPGERIKENQVLALLADQDLQLEIRKLQSELDQYRNGYGAALARSDRVQMVMNQSQMLETQAQLELAQKKLERARIVAPFNGIVIMGDLRQSLGTPVQRGDILLTVAPENAYRLMIEVDERDIAYVKVGQQGKISLVAIPDQAISFYVQRITPVAVAKEGRNYFEVEATLLGIPTSPALHPGLEGIAKITVDQRSFIWVYTHRIVEWIRMTFWTWGI